MLTIANKFLYDSIYRMYTYFPLGGMTSTIPTLPQIVVVVPQIIPLKLMILERWGDFFF